MGCVVGRSEFKLTQKSVVTHKAQSVVALNWFFDMMAKEGSLDQLEVWHEGRCCRCGRKLTVPESIADGIGPECRKHF